jgi:ligand-binding sensor domain-containing protein/two-component sensor histidine kinase
VRRLLFIVIMLILAGTNFIARAQQINIRSYTIEQGLVNNDVFNIYLDRRGFIWLCTRGGLSRYDGNRFTNFSSDNGLISDMINDIFEIGPQEFIIAQNSGGPMLLKNDRLRPLMPSSSITLNRFYPTGDGRLLATSDFNGVVEWTNGGVKPINTSFINSTNKIAHINDSLILVIDLGLYAQLFTPHLEPRSEKMAVGATTVFADSRHRVWVGTTHGLKLLDPSTVQNGKQPVFLPAPPPFDLPMLRQANITDILEDSQGNYWIGTINGLVHVKKEGLPVIYTQQNGLPTSYINCLKEDRQQNIWIGTSMGLAKLPMKREINNFMLDLGYAHGGMLAFLPVSPGEVRVFDGENISYLDLRTGKITNEVSINAAGYSLYHLGPDELMIVNKSKATIFHSKQEETETIDWPGEVVADVVRTKNGQILAAQSDLIFSVRDGRYTQKLRTGTRDGVYILAVDKRNILWLGTFSEGLVKIKIDETQDSLQLSIVDTLAGRLPDRHIRTLFTDTENEVWIGTRYKGAIRLVESSDGKYELQHYATRQGLSSDFVLAINRDPAGNIWIGTAQGIDKLVPSGNGYRVFNFGKVNKIFQKLNAIHFPESNYLLAAGYPSLLHAKDLKQDVMAPLPVYITRISGGPADSNSYTESVNLPYNKGQIYFEFSSPQYINEDFSKFSYRLLGSINAAWNIAGNSGSVYFANLQPGRYTFQVRTLGFNGQWGVVSAYGFTVDAPFWQKAWFILLAILVGGLMIYGIYRYRVQQLIRLQKVRNRIATDLHDEIGSNLTNISILSSLGKKNILQPQKAGDFLERISEEVSSSSQALDDIIWSVDASHDTLEETVARMRRYAAELFDSANISYELYLDPAFERRRLSMEQRRDIYLLYKEAVNNISKHASASHVSIQIAIEYNHLLLSVQDDGKGFDTGGDTNRYGLKGMKQRVKKWKGKINIESGTGQGTFIQVQLPVSR